MLYTNVDRAELLCAKTVSAEPRPIKSTNMTVYMSIIYIVAGIQDLMMWC